MIANGIAISARWVSDYARLIVDFVALRHRRWNDFSGTGLKLLDGLINPAHLANPSPSFARPSGSAYFVMTPSCTVAKTNVIGIVPQTLKVIQKSVE